MFKRSTRWLRTVVLALVPTSLLAASFVLVPGAAYAATVPSITTMGGNINVLPSAVDAATGTAGGLSKADMMAIYMYRASKSPEFWKLYQQAQQQAQSSGKTLVLPSSIADDAKTIYPSAAKYGKFVKTAGHVTGSVGAVMGVYEVVSKLTNGALDLAGVDATNTICTSTGRDLWGLAVQTAAGASCEGYDQKMAESFQPNLDADAGFKAQSCAPNPDDGCASLKGTYTFTNYQGDKSTVWCFSLSGVNWAGNVSSRFGGEYLRNDSKNDQDTWGFSGWAYRGDEITSRPYEAGCNLSGWMATIGTNTDKSITAFSYKFGPQMTKIEKTSGDPVRTLKCVTLGTDGKEYVRESDPFFESAGVLPDPKCSDLPAGVIADNVQIKETGGSQGDDTIWEAKTSEAVKNALTGGCGTTLQCELELLKDGKVCGAGADCEGWFKDPDKSKYECRYGGKVVSLSECTTYAPRWEPEQQKSGDTLGDPKTGEPLKNPRPSLNPSTAPGVGASPADAELGTYNCWPSGWGAFNPLNWVLQPLKCAFVPREGYPKTLQRATTKGWSNTSPAKWGTAMQAWDLRTPGNGCSGIPVSMHYGVLNFDANILAACPGDVLAPFAGWSRLFVGFSLSVVGVFALVRWGGALFGFEGLGRKSDDD